MDFWGVLFKRLRTAAWGFYTRDNVLRVTLRSTDSYELLKKSTFRFQRGAFTIGTIQGPEKS